MEKTYIYDLRGSYNTWRKSNTILLNKNTHNINMYLWRVFYTATLKFKKIVFIFYVSKLCVNQTQNFKDNQIVR